MLMKPILEVRNLTKIYEGGVLANHEVNFSVEEGEIHALVGENGAGKSTLMKMLYGMESVTSGQIFLRGEEVHFNSSKDAIDHGIGMVHQHFKLIDVLSATENIILGLEGRLNIKEASRKIEEICEKYGFEVDPKQKIYDMTVSQKQTVEIVKMLYRGANILILDEPTAVLTPQETEKLFTVLRNMRDQGKSIIIITHKLNEVLALSDRVSVLRKGKYIGTVETKNATAESLTEMMVGEKIDLNIERPDPVNPVKRLVIENLSCVNKEGVKTLKNAYGGEILGIAGIAGSGQKELLEAVAGLQMTESGSVRYITEDGEEKELLSMKPADIKKLGVALSFVPEDRLGMGLVGSMGMTGNMMLRGYNEGRGIFANRKEPKELAEKIVDQLQVSTPSVNTPVSRLSGGNVQKVLVGREISADPTVLMVAYPVRGLDINSSLTIYDLLNEQKKRGVAVICVGEDLDVLLELCDKILVLCGGKITGVVDARKTTKEEIGLLMTKEEEESEA